MGTDILHKYIPDLPDWIQHGAGILKNHGDVGAPKPAPLIGRIVQKRFSLKQNIAFCNFSAARQKPQHRADHRCLAGTGFPDQRGDLSFLQRHAEIFHGGAVLIGDGNIFYFQHRLLLIRL